MKSIDVPLALEWLVARVRPQVVLVRRHPLDVVASRVQLGFLDDTVGYLDERAVATRLERWQSPARPVDARSFAHLVWMAGFAMSAYADVASAHPEFHVVDHERLCSDPTREFQRLVTNLGLVWTDDCHEYLKVSNRPGTGWETNRISAKQPGKWQTTLTGEQREEARELLGQFPIARWYPDLDPEHGGPSARGRVPEARSLRQVT